jgi:hypothetical protein
MQENNYAVEEGTNFPAIPEKIGNYPELDVTSDIDRIGSTPFLEELL